MCVQPTDILSLEKSKSIYTRYIPTIVRCISTFAKEIPQFLDLAQEDQRVLIKSCILEAAVIHDCTHVHLSGQHWLDDKLKFRLHCDGLPALGLIGEVFAHFHQLVLKLRKLDLTDVEVSLLCALVLFCPGETENRW